MPALPPPADKPQLSAPEKDTPTFSPDNISVVFVLGGPGAGKGTQCDKLVRDYGFTHLSAGDLLREEQDREGSQFGSLIKDYIKEGTIVPMEITVQLLENAMNNDLTNKHGNGRFLIDGEHSHPPPFSPANPDTNLAKTGFPRKMDQALKFEEAVCPSKFTLFFDCPEDVMQERLLNRGKTSGRADDNAESIKKRFKTFVDTSMPVVEYFEKQEKVVRIPATRAPDEVYEEVKEKMGQRGFEMEK
ncbi:hypothetical protein MMC11_007920 [Xylographa trunciseda]|nr:hypothetical protein [Xylographa trunciseda]